VHCGEVDVGFCRGSGRTLLLLLLLLLFLWCVHFLIAATAVNGGMTVSVSTFYINMFY